MRRCYITDRRSFPHPEAFLDCIRGNLSAGVEVLQLREKDLSAAELLRLAQRVLALPNPHRTKILINTRMDVALAAGAHGIHLPSGCPAPREFRRLAPPDFVIGVSCHSLEELRQAEAEGADFAVYGPVFRPLSKPDARPVLGLDGLAEGCAAVRIPVFALGGITWEAAAQCEAAGAAGVAGITLFQTGRQEGWSARGSDEEAREARIRSTQ